MNVLRILANDGTTTHLGRLDSVGGTVDHIRQRIRTAGAMPTRTPAQRVARWQVGEDIGKDLRGASAMLESNAHSLDRMAANVKAKTDGVGIAVTGKVRRAKAVLADVRSEIVAAWAEHGRTFKRGG